MAGAAMERGGITIERVAWASAKQILRPIRQTVFVEEQLVPPDLEWDVDDDVCVHLIARRADGAPIGTARIHPTGQIGRMAVLAAHRRSGVGRALLEEALRVARENGAAQVVVHAQTRACGFYERAGFRAEGEVFMDAGIPHRLMRLDLSRRP